MAAHAKGARLFIAICAIVAALCGCHARTAHQSYHSIAAGSEQINPLPYDQVPAGGDLRWPLERFPANFNWLEIDGQTSAPALLTLPVVWHVGASGTPFLNTDVVDMAKIVSTDPQIVSYHINPRAVWSNGASITYREFAGIAVAMNGKNPAYKPAFTTGYDRIRSVVRGATDRDVAVTFARPYPEWQSLFSPLVPAWLTATPEAFTKSWVRRPDVSGGPFAVTTIDRTAGVITLARNPHWWGRRAKLDTVTVKILDGPAQVRAFQSDQIDWMDIGPDAALYRDARRVPGTVIRWSAGRTFQHLDLGQQGAMADVTVRQAVLLGLDRANDVKTMLGPVGVPPATLDSHIWMNNQPQYRATCAEFCTSDLARAGALLQRAGYAKDARGFYARNGRELSLQLLVTPTITTLGVEAGIQQNALRKAGIKVVLRSLPTDSFWDRVVTGNFDMVMYYWVCTPFPVSDARELYSTAGTANFTKIGSPELDRTLNEANSTLDTARRLALTYQADRMIWAEGHSAPLYQRPDIVAEKKTLVNFGAFGFADTDYTAIGFRTS